jgi:ribosomal protein S18 acetylase RimI-like enzyme
VPADVHGRAEIGEVRRRRLGGDVHRHFVLPGTGTRVSGPGEAEFRMLAVAPAAWGRGVGELLARACIARAREVGASAIMICTRDFATTAQKIYERLGFARVPERDWQPMPGVNLFALRLEL